MPKYVVVGLGNPGSRFTNTRHNLGQRAVQAWQLRQPELAAQVVIYNPTVFMNEIGPELVTFLRDKYLTPDELIIIHDDVELAFGEIKIKKEGSANGHNGVRSIQEALGTQVITRIRLGVGRPTVDQELSDFVLRPFTAEEEARIPEFLIKAGETLTDLINPLPA